MSGLDFLPVRFFLPADVRGERAARAKVAALGRVGGARQVALQDDRLAIGLGDRIGDRHGREQGLAVGVQGTAVDVGARGQLDHLAQVHDRDAIGDMTDHAEVVADEEVGQAELVLQVLQQVDHLRLDRDVEGRDRLVADDELGVERQGPGDPDPLALAAGELVRIAIGEVAGRGRPRSSSSSTLLLLLPPHEQAMLVERLGDDGADRHARIEAGLRVLEHHLHVRPDLAQGLALERRSPMSFPLIMMWPAVAR